MSGQDNTRSKRGTAKVKSAASRGKAGAAPPTSLKPPDFGLVVGIGASAGGLSAFKSFLSNTPSDSGMAFILVQHLSPDYKSMLTDLLSRATDMPVLEAEDGMPVEANRVFVIPPDSTLTVKDRRLQLERPAPPRERRRPIDTFFSTGRGSRRKRCLRRSCRDGERRRSWPEGDQGKRGPDPGPS
jgi:two-component system, chemotaxis family, CheB/CheR fusion protein